MVLNSTSNIYVKPLHTEPCEPHWWHHKNFLFLTPFQCYIKIKFEFWYLIKHRKCKYSAYCPHGRWDNRYGILQYVCNTIHFISHNWHCKLFAQCTLGYKLNQCQYLNHVINICCIFDWNLIHLTKIVNDTQIDTLIAIEPASKISLGEKTTKPCTSRIGIGKNHWRKNVHL